MCNLQSSMCIISTHSMVHCILLSQILPSYHSNSNLYIPIFYISTPTTHHFTFLKKLFFKNRLRVRDKHTSPHKKIHSTIPKVFKQIKIQTPRTISTPYQNRHLCMTLTIASKPNNDIQFSNLMNTIKSPRLLFSFSLPYQHCSTTILLDCVYVVIHSRMLNFA